MLICPHQPQTFIYFMFFLCAHVSLTLLSLPVSPPLAGRVRMHVALALHGSKLAQCMHWCTPGHAGGCI